ncbi:tRNA (N(6)-L-threonylcarbamoyladenosine(37)-C(2))-methylthiotransferase MtaB [Collinsella ureilytica]|uniref:tRNA (N(6)-L-threonylcarbamoyladenosine(37)-C(2))- methylthiotransferase MtaB n=1 Tax=Collinsella ureilytica TaxID=2869515 RepID=UPI00352FE370
MSVINLGCRVNRVETDRIAADFASAGFPIVEDLHADLVVINTCAVTGEAEAKTRKAIRRALNLPRTPLVIATGCAVNLHAEALRSLSHRVIAEPIKTRVVSAARKALSLNEMSHPDAPTSYMPSGELASGERAGLIRRARPGVKIQDGCNHRCSFCIVWKARGPERSEPLESVLSEIDALVDAGAAEVVLTGVNLGAYRGLDAQGRQRSLAQLIQEILSRTQVGRVRISSIEPMDIDDELIELMGSESERIAPFLHLPIQSGSTTVLRRMARPYTDTDLLQLVDAIRSSVPQIALSADVILGFPGETDEEFASTHAFCERVGFSRLHVFRYSPRPGTVAANRQDQVEPALAASRAAAIRELAQTMTLSDAKKRIGTVEYAAIEDGRCGTLGSFHRVRIEGTEELSLNHLIPVAIIGCDESGVLIGMPAHV